MMLIADLTPTISKAARALLAWSQADLARQAKIGTSTVADFERGHRDPQAGNAEAMRSAFEQGGLRFVGGGVLADTAQVPAVVTSGGNEIFRYISATDLQQWAGRLPARSRLPELITRLIRADLGLEPQLRFPTDEGIEHPGWDGTCLTGTGRQYVPRGQSGWELGTQKKGVAAKATVDFKKRLENPDGLDPSTSTFVFVTSQRWSKKNSWIRARKAERRWLDVIAYDIEDLVHWIEKHPGVGLWLANGIGKYPKGIRQLESFWNEWISATNGRFSGELILADREDEATRIHKWLQRPGEVLTVKADSTDEAIAFLHASLQRLPKEYRPAYQMRCLVVASADDARQLAESASSLIIVIADPPLGLAQLLSNNGHHVLAAYGTDIELPDDACILPRPWPESIASALYDIMATAHPTARQDQLRAIKDDASRLAEDAGRSLTILRRRMSPGGAPEWVKSSNVRALMTSILAGGWDESNEEDVKIVEQLYRGTYADLTHELGLLLEVADSPIRRIGEVWRVASPRDAWFLLSPRVTSADLDALEASVFNVFRAPHPGYSADIRERYRAAVNGLSPRHSASLREGLLRTLLLLALFGNRIPGNSTGDLRASRIVRTLLENADAGRWWSVSDSLRLLVEVSPLTFLEVVEDSLASSDASVTVLLQEVKDAFSRSYVSELLWGLEALAWDPKYLAPVSLVLAGLAAKDNGEHAYQNRPKNTLLKIFLTLYPQTNATLDERLQVIDLIRERESTIAWRLMRDIYPKGGAVVTQTAKPQWRTLSVNEGEGITGPLLVHAAEELARRLLEDAGAHIDRWVDMVRFISALQLPELRDTAIGKIEEFASGVSDDGDRFQLRSALRSVVAQHREFSQAKWAMPVEIVDRLDAIDDLLEPSDPVARAQWAFDAPRGLSWSEGDNEDRRGAELTALSAVIDAMGADGILKIARQVRIPRMVGVALGRSGQWGHLEEEILRRGLVGSPHAAERELALGLACGRIHHSGGVNWAEKTARKAIDQSWGALAVAAIAGELPISRETWGYVASLGKEVDDQYWKHIFIYSIKDDLQAVSHAIDKLIEVGRTHHATELAGNRVQDDGIRLRRIREAVEVQEGRGSDRGAQKPEAGLPAEQLVRVLQELLKQPPSTPLEGNDATMLYHYVTEILTYLERTEDCGSDTLARLEWAFLPMLQFSDRQPRAILDELSRNPGLFVEVLSSLYRPEKDSGLEGVTPMSPEQVEARAERAYQLLSEWNRPPGSRDGEGIDPDELMAWIEAARKACQQFGRVDPGDVHIGEMLAKSGADRAGSWPQAAVCRVIEATRSRSLEDGFVNGAFNKRGATMRAPTDGGKLERAEAVRYRDRARALTTLYPRTAALLEKIARNFDADARWHDERAELHS